MWEKLQHAVQHPVMQFLKKLCGDPVQLYTILLLTAIMQYYHSDFTWLYTIAAVFLSWAMMRFYEFVARHRFLGPLCYLVYMALGLFAVSVLADVGSWTYPISFGVWFLTPQSVVDFTIWYTLAIFLLMTGFLSSAVFYFAKVRYRMVMQFLIMLIPLSMYAKEGIQAPALYVIALLSSYFLLMVYCRQLRETPEVRRLSNIQTGISVAVYVLSFSILAAIIPKPAVKADREYIENVLSYSSWSDILMDAISMFTDSTDNSMVMTNNTRTVYYLQTPESLRLRTQTFSYYLEDDSWNKTDAYDYPETAYSDMYTYQPRALLQAILDAAAADASFAETYALSDYAGEILPVQDAQTLIVVPNFRGGRLLPSPTRLCALEEWRQPQTLVSPHSIMTQERGYYEFRIPIRMSYYSDTYAHYARVSEVLSVMEQETYAALLQEAAVIMESRDPEAAAILQECLDEHEDALTYLEHCETLDFQSEAIDTLAAEITAGLTSDYEKARAIERYFAETGFIYDLNYQKAEEENAETFLLETRRGVCYEFATAMVLLCRSAGLPARYVQGYSLNEQYENAFNEIETNYLIKMRDAHGFPEVYIAGYGWLSFEPTVISGSTTEETAENHYVMLWGFVILGGVILAAAVYFSLPAIRENLFRRRISRMDPCAAAAAIFVRMRRILQLPDSATVMELAAQSEPFCGEDAAMQQLFVQLDILLYDRPYAAENDHPKLTEAYMQWQSNWKQYEKSQKKAGKHRKQA